MRALAVAASGFFWVLVVAVPLIAVIARTADWELITDPSVLAIARATLWQASLSTVFSAIFGLVLGLRVGVLSGKPSQWSRVLLAMPYGIPTVVVGAAWIVWLGRSGLDWAYSLSAVIIAHVFLNIPWIALVVSQARAHVPVQTLEAAKTLGAGRWAIFRFVTWPAVRWVFASGCAQVFSLCVMSFALVLILGGGPPVQTLETAIYSRMRSGLLDISGAAACAFWEVLLTLFPWVLVLVLGKVETGLHEKGNLIISQTASQTVSKIVSWICVGLCAVFLLPYCSVIWAVIIEGGSIFTPEFFNQIAEPLRVSLGLAAATGAGALIVAGITVVGARYSVIYSVLMALPAGISVVVLGLGLWLAYGRWLDLFTDSRWAWVAMVVIQVAVFYPVAFRMFWPVAKASNRALTDAAATLGASAFQVFKWVEWPRWKGPVFSALGMIVGASLSEVAAVSLFATDQLIPLPLLVTRWMAQYHFGAAQALSALLLILSIVLIGSISIWGTLGANTKNSETR